jgi:hypothetical protein
MAQMRSEILMTQMVKTWNDNRQMFTRRVAINNFGYKSAENWTLSA